MRLYRTDGDRFRPEALSAQGGANADRSAEAVASRTLLAISARRFHNEGNIADLQDVDRLAAAEPRVRPREEIQDHPGVVGNAWRTSFRPETIEPSRLNCSVG